MTSRTARIALFTIGGAAAGFTVQQLLGRRKALNLADQVVLITGGSRGLGLALGGAFAAQGCRIAICARDATELEGARQYLTERGAEVFIQRCDVSNRED